MNDKYTITDIAHPEYPFLHRIQALRDIGETVKKGDLGGYVETEKNLSYAPGDTAWIYGDAICCNDALVDMDAALMDHAIACDSAYISRFAVMKDHARAEDESYLRGGTMREDARISGCASVCKIKDSGKAPVLRDRCTIYGVVNGDVQICGSTVVLGTERISNDELDQIVIRDGTRSVVRAPERNQLHALEKRNRKREQDARSTEMER